MSNSCEKSGNTPGPAACLKGMEIKEAEYIGAPDLAGLKPLLSAEGPCLSVYLPLNRDASPEQARKTDALVWQGLISELEEGELHQSVLDWEEIRNASAAGKAQSLAVFRSPDMFRVIGLHSAVAPRAVTGSQFFLRPLLKEAGAESQFYLLALSLNDVRLLRCTHETSEEVALASGVATGYDAYMASVDTDTNRSRGAAAGAGAGSSKGITGTTVTERESKSEYVAHFFKQIDRAVNETLRGRKEPLVLAGVNTEVSEYKRVNSYPHITEDFVRGAPNGLKAGEMHARAITALEGHYASRVDARLAEYNHKAGSGATNRLKDIVTAAHDGRVTSLLISDTAESHGNFDDATNAASGQAEGGVDLINDATIQTLLHAGTVMVASNKQMPQGAPAIAILRY